MKPSSQLLLLPIHSGLRFPLFARVFWAFTLVLAILIAGPLEAVTLKSRSSEDFQNLDQEELFWRRKNIFSGMEKNRKIPVSTVRKKNQWQFKGAGVVQVPGSFAFENAKDFNRLAKLPQHFEDIRFNPETSTLRMKVFFLKKERILELALFEQTINEEKRMYFRSIGEWMKGMEGVLLVKDLGRQSAEVGIVSTYPGEFEWVPNIFVSVGSEAVMHHVAESLRKTLESDYKSHAQTSAQ